MFVLFFRAVTDSINQLITLCTQQAPGQKECDNALRELEVNLLVSDYLLAFLFYVGIGFTHSVLLICSSGCQRNAGQPQRTHQ